MTASQVNAQNDRVESAARENLRPVSEKLGLLIMLLPVLESFVLKLEETR